MKDIVGNEIVVGSKVVFAKGGKHALYKGEVTKINAKTVAVTFQGTSTHWDGQRWATDFTRPILLNRAPENVVVYFD